MTLQSGIYKKPQRVVLLGARGFIGQALKKRLDVDEISNLALTSSDIDLASADAAPKLASLITAGDAVVMLAARTPDKGRDVATLMKNLAMMQNVCVAIEKSGCSHLVYFSSDAVYDSAVSRVTESTPPSPKDLYGVMHLTREVMARNLKNIPLLVLRPTLVYGLGDTHNAYGPNRFLRSALKDKKIALFGGGEETRDHVHVDDVAALTIKCLMTRGTGILNIATGVSKSFREIAELVVDEFADEIEITETPRISAVTHRHYDITNLVKSFPDFRFVSGKQGFEEIHHQLLLNVSVDPIQTS
ncbi:MAG: NAD(P)-dependent oxidoreductase [Polaromonas sp.]|uniref:NAD-dependent epimerase/dehydratase family protein n=1 Tax=Polaromonas sp. TaxID=1869339 RepID=UPI002489FBA5|nr:NAD(P)-dependent oxidoreductase [Polaromonas sp.]MDI1270392.1 NAD(P)-dependent oxidoreductase [Polaromonas sp.]